MARGFDVRFDAALAQRARATTTLAAQVQATLAKAATRIGQRAADRARVLTPRSDGPGPHLADGWVAEPRASGVDIVVRVYNRDPRATQPLRLANGATLPYTLLDVLEYGSSAHVITPSRAPMLVFFWPKVGRVVRAMRVDHPGTRPYGMIAGAKVQANIDTKQALDAIRTAIRTVLSGRP